MAEPIPPSAQSSSYSLTTLASHVSTDRRAVTDMNGKTRTLRCAPFLCRLRRRECCTLGAPSSQPTVPLHELPPARLVIIESHSYSRDCPQAIYAAETLVARKSLQWYAGWSCFLAQPLLYADQNHADHHGCCIHDNLPCLKKNCLKNNI